MIKEKRLISNQFFLQTHKVDFILIFISTLAVIKKAIDKAMNQESINKIIANEWEFKRWFWSFLENAVIQHTKTIHVERKLLEQYDVKLITNSLKSLGVEIKTYTVI